MSPQDQRDRDRARKLATKPSISAFDVDRGKGESKRPAESQPVQRTTPAMQSSSYGLMDAAKDLKNRGKAVNKAVDDAS